MTTTTAARLDATGPRRRIQGLVWAGWTGRQLAGLSGLTEQAISRLALGVSTTVAPATARAVEDLYDQAWQGPAHPSEWARRRAIRSGWAPPLAWDDDIIDDPAARPEGIRPRLRGPESYADSVLELHHEGMPPHQIAAEFGISQYTVERIIRKTRRTAA